MAQGRPGASQQALMPSILSSGISFLLQNTGLTPELLDYLHEAFGEILEDWRCRLLELGEVHLLVKIHPALNISTLVNNLKTASARRVRNRFSEHLKAFYLKPYFWHRVYYLVSVGGATLETVRRYLESQGTREKPRKAKPPV